MEYELIYALIDRIKQSLSVCDRFHMEDEIRGLKMQEKLDVAKSYLFQPEDYQRLVAEVYRDYLIAMETVTNVQIDAIIHFGNTKIAHGYFADLTPSV